MKTLAVSRDAESALSRNSQAIVGRKDEWALRLTQEGRRRIADTERLAVRLADGRVEVRASALSQCLRKVWYVAMGQVPTDEESSVDKARKRAGQVLGDVVKDFLVDEGFALRDAPEIAILLGRSRDLLVTGNPDCMGSHRDHADGALCVVVKKTRGGSWVKRVRQEGVERVSVGDAWQAALYAHAIAGRPADVMVVTVSREDYDYDVQVIPAERVAWLYADAIDRAMLLRKAVREERIPEPELPMGNWMCQRCEFRTVCGNAVVTDEDSVVALDEKEMAQKVSEWDVADKEGGRQAAKRKKSASDTIKLHLNAVEQDDVDVDVAGRTFRLKLSKWDEFDVDYEKLHELTTIEQRDAIIRRKPRSRLDISEVSPV